MYIQGDLQSVFDALFHLGVIDPVLEMDWKQAISNMPSHYPELFEALEVVNSSQPDVEQLMSELEKFNSETLKYLAMEVAKEFADFHSRELLH